MEVEKIYSKFEKGLKINGQTFTDDNIFTDYFRNQTTVRTNTRFQGEVYKVVQLNMAAKIRQLLPKIKVNQLRKETKEIVRLLSNMRDIIVGYDGGIFVDRLENLYDVIFPGMLFEKYTERFPLESLLRHIPGMEIFTGTNRRRICRIGGDILPTTHQQFSPAVKKYFFKQKSTYQSQQIQTLLLHLPDNELENLTINELGPLFEDLYKKPMKSIDPNRKLEFINNRKSKRKRLGEGMEVSSQSSQLSSFIESLPNSCGVSNLDYDPYFRGEEDLYVFHYRRHNTTQENIEHPLKSR